MTWNPAKLIALLLCLVFWILLAFAVVGCANVSRVQEEEGWFPVGMDEDGQSFYNSKYNMMDSSDGSRGNSNIKVFNTKY